ncbi:MAG: hypothetical protein Q8O67_28715 [Deltaproteobacteria bacterium]|nr:hypothetical protein [Deltaproteobacteria bacterium]
MRWAVVVVVVAAVAAAGSGCAECSVEGDECSIGQVCSEGVCAQAPGDSMTIVSGPDVDTPTFDLVLRVTFQGAVAVLKVTRSSGEECVPFVPVQLTLFGDDDENIEQEVIVPGLVSVGAFDLDADLDIEGRKVHSDQSFRGPAAGDDFGGAVFRSPGAGEIDVVDGAWQPLQADVAGGRITAFVTPGNGVAIPGRSGESTPRVVVAEASTAVDAFVPLLRGPQIVWLETDDGAGGILRCGRGVLGGPLVDDGGALELALLTDSAELAWLGMTARITDDDGEAICDSELAPAICVTEVLPVGPAEHNAEVLRVRIDNGVVEVAAVPRIISGPVTARIRVSRAGRHEGFLGPFSLFPAEGQAWFAGRVIIEGGRVAGIVAVDDVTLGAPW